MNILSTKSFYISIKPDKFYWLILLLLITGFSVSAQHFYRLSADFTIKKKNFDSTFQLVKGTIYYDDVVGKLTFRHTFPEKETYIMIDTNTYHFADGKYLGRSFSMMQPRTSFIALLLKGGASNYGFETSNYVLDKVEEENGLTMATWLPPPTARNVLGKVVVANKDDLLFGVVYHNVEGEILSKQFFEDYTHIDGVDFPTRVTQIFYKDGKESFQVTTYKNIKVDEKGNDALYDFPLESYLR